MPEPEKHHAGDDVNDRSCIVSGRRGDPDAMIRFVAAPDGSVVPDIARKLPGRGCWVTATHEHVSQAVAKKRFARGLKQTVTVALDLADTVDALLARDAQRGFAMARKAGAMTAGAMQVDQAVRKGEAIVVLHALEAADDGVRKIDQARRATVHLGGPDIPAFRLFSVDEMDLAFGHGNVIHAAILDGGAGHAALRRIRRLDRYRHGGHADRVTNPGRNTEQE
jgi:predicted RNA-binding protein YlxR (DUF448 family)